MNFKKITDEEIRRKMEMIENMDPDTKEYQAAVDSITKLMDRAIKLEEIEKEAKSKEAELKIDKKDKMARNIITGVSVGGGLGVTVWGALKTFKFEETGYVTSSVGRKFIDGLIKTFKK